MASLDMLLMGKLIHSGDMTGLLAAGFIADDLQTKEGLRLWSLVEGHYSNPITYGEVPSLAFLESHIPGLELPNPESSFDSLVHAARNYRIVRSTRSAIKEALPKLGDTYEASAVSTIVELRDYLEEIIRQSTATTDSTVMKGFSSTVSLYEAIRSGEIQYLPWAWPELHQFSPGIAPTDYVVIYGRPKNKKTFLLLFFIVSLFFQGKRIVLYSKEMPAEEIWQRVVAFIANLPFEGIYNTRLSNSDYEQLYAAEDKIRDVMRRFPRAEIICVSGMDAPQGTDSVAWFASKVRHYQPDLAVVDGLYLMAGDAKVKDDHLRVQGISRALRSMALRLKIPVLATIQANRKADKTGKDPMTDDTDLGEVAFSDAIGQDATTLMRVVADKLNPVANVLVTGGRNWSIRGFQIWAVPCTNFRWIRLLDESAAQHSLKQEEEEDVLTPAPVSKRGKRKKADPAEVRSILEDRVDDLME